MGEAAAKERTLKDMTRAQITELVDETMMQFVAKNLPELIDGIVKDRIAEYHGLCVARGLFVTREERGPVDRVTPGGLHVVT